MLIITIKQGKEKSILAGDPWIYPTAIERVDGRPQEKNKPGATAVVQSSSRHFLARAAYNAKAAQISARVWTLREDEPVDHALIKRRVRAALARRADGIARLGPEDLLNVIEGEPDGLPGLVVDYYGGKDGFLLCSFQAAAAEAWKVPIVQALVADTGCGNVFQRSDAELRAGEGLPVFSRELAGAAPPAKSIVRQRGERVYMDLKTGFEFPKRPV